MGSGLWVPLSGHLVIVNQVKHIKQYDWWGKVAPPSRDVQNTLNSWDNLLTKRCRISKIRVEIWDHGFGTPASERTFWPIICEGVTSGRNLSTCWWFRNLATSWYVEHPWMSSTIPPCTTAHRKKKNVTGTSTSTVYFRSDGHFGFVVLHFGSDDFGRLPFEGTKQHNKSHHNHYNYMLPILFQVTPTQIIQKNQWHSFRDVEKTSIK